MLDHTKDVRGSLAKSLVVSAGTGLFACALLAALVVWVSA